MRFLLKLTVLVAVINGLFVSGIVAQRLFVPSYVEQVLVTEACALDCWFGVEQSMHLRDIEMRVVEAGGRDGSIRGSLMRYRIPGEDEDTDRNRGRVQIELDGEGRATQICYFPQDFTLGHIITAFGPPEAFFLDLSQRRLLSSRFSNQLEAYTMAFQMIYPDDNMTAVGSIFIDAREEAEMTLPPEAPIERMCTPGNINFDNIDRLPRWHGLLQNIEIYKAFPPLEPSDDTLFIESFGP